MLERMIYFSGVAGTDREGLIEELLKRNERYIKGNAESVRKRRRSVYRNTRELIEERAEAARRHAELEELYPDKAVLADRSLHDTTAYILLQEGRHRLDGEEARELLIRQWATYTPALLPQKTVYLDYKLEDVKRHLHKEQGWRNHRLNEDAVKQTIRTYKDYFGSLDQGRDLLRLYVDDHDATIPVVERWVKERTGI
ncbi:hypothetical protein KY327_02370 [Candidatus Woesearchaeota archaeon]|nr:hypothetical protein [Candidatus Woesearchaeota archaeon]